MQENNAETPAKPNNGVMHKITIKEAQTISEKEFHSIN